MEKVADRDSMPIEIENLAPVGDPRIPIRKRNQKFDWKDFEGTKANAVKQYFKLVRTYSRLVNDIGRAKLGGR